MLPLIWKIKIGNLKKMDRLEEIGIGLDALVIFKNLRHDKVIRAMINLLESPDLAISQKIKAYRNFVSELYDENEDLTSYVLQKVLEDENIYIRKKGMNLTCSDEMQSCLIAELKLLQSAAMLTEQEIADSLFKDYNGFLPSWKISQRDFVAKYSERTALVSKHGYGIFARYHMFTLDNEGKIVPVKYPDPVSLSQLVGYETERQKVIDNTKALLDCKPAANVLLSGDAGTGKSTTVKAVANAFQSEGLRIIEITKHQICEIPKLMDMLCTNPLKFIIFIDDLTFTEDDADFSSLKAMLEGSVSSRAKNTVIYATSNRRHMIKETFSARAGDELHRNDTIQELTSLSERFGLHITYSKPNQALFLRIVKELCTKEGINMPEKEIEIKAEAYALRKSGRSARAARQFVDYLHTQI